MELKHLRSFLVVAEEGGISAAARRLGMTQPALSRQIKAMEEDLGVVLLDRGARSFVLTPAAEMLWERGRRMVEDLDSMIEELRSHGSGKPLRIGYSPSLAFGFLPAAIQSFSQRHPAPRIALHELSSLEMIRMLGRRELEVIVGVPTSSVDPVDWTCLKEHQWKVMVGERHEWADGAAVQAADLGSVPLLIYDRIQYPDYWARISRYFRDHQVEPKVRCEFDGISSLAAAVEANLGLAIVAESTQVVRDGSRKIRVLDLAPQPESIRVSAGVSGRHTADPHVLAFIEELRLAAGMA